MFIFHIPCPPSLFLFIEKPQDSAVIYDEVQLRSSQSHTHTGRRSAQCWRRCSLMKVTVLCALQKADATLWCVPCCSVWWQHVSSSPSSPCCQWSSPSLSTVSLLVSLTRGWFSAGVTLCFLSTAVNKVISTQDRAQSDLTERIERLQEVQVRLEREAVELSEERDRLNWTLGVILEYQNFPVANYCPHRGEPDRQTDTFKRT